LLLDLCTPKLCNTAEAVCIAVKPAYSRWQNPCCSICELLLRGCKAHDTAGAALSSPATKKSTVVKLCLLYQVLLNTLYDFMGTFLAFPLQGWRLKLFFLFWHESIFGFSTAGLAQNGCWGLKSTRPCAMLGSILWS